MKDVTGDSFIKIMEENGAEFVDVTPPPKIEYIIIKENETRWIVKKKYPDVVTDAFPVAVCKSEKEANNFIAKQRQKKLGF